jgi:hypothetical protein
MEHTSVMLVVRQHMCSRHMSDKGPCSPQLNLQAARTTQMAGNLRQTYSGKGRGKGKKVPLGLCPSLAWWLHLHETMHCRYGT